MLVRLDNKLDNKLPIPSNDSAPGAPVGMLPPNSIVLFMDVTRNRELVVQFIITLANYEYIFAYKFDQSGGITD
jgi:hypothetical protein